MAVSADLGKALLQAVVGGKTYTPPTNWYLGLSSQAIVNDEIPAGAEPPEGIGYARKEIPNNGDSFTAPGTDGSRGACGTNAQSIMMDEITGGTEPTVQYFFLAETSQNSNAASASRKVSMWGSLDRARTLAVNSNLIIDTGGALFELVNVD